MFSFHFQQNRAKIRLFLSLAKSFLRKYFDFVSNVLKKQRDRRGKVSVALRRFAAAGRESLLPDSDSLPSAGGFRRASKSRCRREEDFAELQKVAAVGRRISQGFKRSLPLGGGFRRASKGRCRRREHFVASRQFGAGGVRGWR